MLESPVPHAGVPFSMRRLAALESGHDSLAPSMYLLLQ